MIWTEPCRICRRYDKGSVRVCNLLIMSYHAFLSLPGLYNLRSKKLVKYVVVFAFSPHSVRIQSTEQSYVFTEAGHELCTDVGQL